MLSYGKSFSILTIHHIPFKGQFGYLQYIFANPQLISFVIFKFQNYYLQVDFKVPIKQAFEQYSVEKETLILEGFI
jgi:hypothetical protein